ncbi:hypothetical protein A2U01_0004108 [Trifolium medium]|uniref:Uncharacterized protein n=1 Tax=Trifolium medium TaxID=97028 RepID=A0A392M7U0_9FABA|nr:hypothetical protein [Trifolium medium]
MDEWQWGIENGGDFTVKSTYRFLANLTSTSVHIPPAEECVFRLPMPARGCGFCDHLVENSVRLFGYFFIVRLLQGFVWDLWLAQSGAHSTSGFIYFVELFERCWIWIQVEERKACDLECSPVVSMEKAQPR